ncbi:MAG: Hsp70 family protein, partial [Acidobacteriota bacterium]
YSTADDNQNQVEINVLQGERSMASDNKTLGRFHLMGIPPAPRGVPQVEVTFDIDANGILHVAAKDRGTGVEQKIQITGSSGLSEDEIGKMVDEAQAHAGDDEAKRRQIESRNKLDGLVYSTEKLVAENKDKLAEDDVASIESALAEAKSALEDGSLEGMDSAYEKLTSASHKVAETLYQSQAQQPGPDAGAHEEAPPAENSTGEEEVIDAEYVDVDAESDQ